MNGEIAAVDLFITEGEIEVSLNGVVQWKTRLQYSRFNLMPNQSNKLMPLLKQKSMRNKSMPHLFLANSGIKFIDFGID